MTPDTFEHLLELFGTKTDKKYTRLWKVFPPRERMATILRFFAFGES